MVVAALSFVVKAAALDIHLIPKLVVNGEPQAEYDLEYTTNIPGGWTFLAHVAGDDTGIITYIDGNADSNAMRAYRLVKTAGSALSIILDNLPAEGTVIEGDGDVKVASYRVQTDASEMKLTSLALEFDKRLWLYIDRVTIMDGTTVIAQKDNLSATDFTELVAGVNYSLYLPVSDYHVTISPKHFTVLVHARLPTDRPSAPIKLKYAQVRATDVSGVTQKGYTGMIRTFLYKGVVGQQVVAILDATSPLQGLVQISQAAQTDNVLMGKFDIKSQNGTGTLRQIVIGLHVENTSFEALFGDVKINVNGHTYSADAIVATSGSSGGGSSGETFTTSDGYARFSNMNEVLPTDQYVTVSVYGRINQDVNGTTLTGKKASVSLTTSTSPVVMNNPEVEDAAYQPIDVIQTTIQASELTFSSSSAVVSGMAASLGAVIVVDNVTVAQAVSFTFTLTAGNNTLYLAADPILALSWMSTGLPSQASAALSIGGVIANPGSISGDADTTSTTGHYVIPAGSSRTFTFQGSMDNTGGTHGTKTMRIIAIKYGTSSSALTANTINYNLATLKVEMTL